MATGSTRYRPDWSSGGITAPDVGEVLLDYADRMAKQQNAGLDRAMREQQVAEEQRRWDIANARAQRKEDRELAEQTASDAYYKELLKGPQAVGGILNRESVINQASQFDFTPEEIAFSNTNKISTPEQARKLGNEALAKKMEGQLALSKSVDTMYTQGVLDETRPEMYERALGAVTSRGLPVSKELVASLDAARLAEQTAADAKLKENREAESQLLKNQREDLWKVVNARTGGNSFTDADGNTVTLPSLQREIKAGNKADVSGVNTLQETINKLGFDNPEKKEAAIKQSNEYVKLLEARNIPTDAAADIVASELSKKESNPWLSYVGFGSMDPKFDTKSINTYADMIAERYNKTIPTGSTPLTGTDSYPSKFELASILADSNAVSTSNELARLRAERAALLDTPEERRGSRIDEFMRPKETAASTSTGSMAKGNTVADRNNNPGNLTGNDNWEGKVGMDGRFVKFQSYELGSRALAKNLINGAIGKTVEDYMNKYAPKSENDTNAYIANVSKALGKSPDSVITSKDIFPLMKVIAKQEGGKVDEAKLKAGYELATVLTGNKPFNSTANTEVPTKTIKEMFGNVADTTVDKLNDPASLAFIGKVKDELSANKGGPLDERLAIQKLKSQLNISEQDAKNIVSEEKNKEISDNNIARRNYLIAKANGTYKGRTADEWYDELSTKDKIGDKAWLAPIIAGLAPVGLALLGGIGAGGATGTGTATGTGFTMQVGQDLVKRATAELAKSAKDKAIQEEIASLVSKNLDPTSIKRLLDISASNSKFSAPIREFLKTRGF